MSILINWLVSAFAILVTAYLLPGVHVLSFTSALVTAVVLGVINAFIKPILLILTLPINILVFLFCRIKLFGFGNFSYNGIFKFLLRLNSRFFSYFFLGFTVIKNS